MSITSGRKGGRIVMEKRRPLRDPAILQERDRSLYAKYVEGHTAREVGKIFGLSESIVCRRIKKIPAVVRAHIRKDVERTRRQRLVDIRAEHEAINA